MVGIPIFLIFAGYTAGTWGYVLVKGYNITLREWVTPLHPWSGPLTQNGTVPTGSIFPTTGKGGAASGGGGSSAPLSGQQQAGRKALAKQGRPPVQ